MSSNLLLHVSDAQTVLIFAFIGGFVDAAGYLKLQGIFTSSITGNLVIACASVTKLEGVLSRALCSISFAFGAFMTNLVATKLKRTYKVHGAVLASLLVGLESVMFLINLLVGDSLDTEISDAINLDAAPIVILSCLMGFTMGVQNGALREGFVNFPATTVMTSTLVNVSAMTSHTMLLYLEYYGFISLKQTAESNQCIVSERTDVESTPAAVSNEVNDNAVSAKAAAREADKTKCIESFSKLALLGRPLISFLVGAVVGAVMMHRLSFISLIVPLVLSAAVVVEILLKHCNRQTDETNVST